MDYRAPVEEMLFSLRHGAGAGRLPSWDDEVAPALLGEAARFIEGEIAPLDPLGDLSPPRIVDGRVRVAPAFRTAYGRYREAGWGRLAAPTEHGGEAQPEVLAACVSEMFAGACASFQMFLSLAHAAIRTLDTCGSAEQRARLLPRLVSGEWLATMCLTEPQAGSDLARIRCLATAEPTSGGTRRWRLQGDKIFISAGDHDLADNILHLVLARTPGGGEGTRGLSLFLCPAVLPDGRRNAVSCLRIEEKMGLHASPTCHLQFDGAEAELLGTEGKGLAHMFVMMNAQRLDVAGQATGMAQAALQRARCYAAERLQGRDGSARAVAIERHGDVQRMLLTQLALTEGCRALIQRTGVELELGHKPALVDFLTPVCKAFATDCAVETAQLAIQVHGGYGYLREFRVEQVLRDVRITQIYEGTNGILAKTLVERLLCADGGAPAQAFRDEILDACACAGEITAAALGSALGHWSSAADTLLRSDGAAVAAAPFMRLTGLVAVGSAWARLEAAAAQAPHPARVRAGAAAFRHWLLPECAALAARIHHPLPIPEDAEALWI
jgi:alkylation response protein AidB-like acyl-CoA dehydrogenase